MVRAAVILLLLLLLPSAVHAQKRVALVIGNSAYRHAPELANPKNDAADMASTLRMRGFQVIDGFDLNKTAFEGKISEFATALQGAEAGVFFYAGHGLQVSGQNYIVPVDARLATASALDLETVRLDVVQRIMENEAPTNILFLDACRDNPLARNLARAMGTRSVAIGRGLAAVESGGGTLVSFSTQPGNVALDGIGGRNSPFAGALARHISSSNEDLFGILIAVRNDVKHATQDKQVPWEHSALTGRFYFNAAAASPGAPPKAQAPPAIAAIAPEAPSSVAPWRVECSSDGKPLECRATQKIFHRETKQWLASAAVRPVAGGKTGVLLMTIPVGLNLAEPVLIRVDNGASEKQTIQSCTNAGCFVTMTLPGRFVAAMRTGTELRITIQDANKRWFELPMPLVGFGAALDRAR